MIVRGARRTTLQGGDAVLGLAQFLGDGHLRLLQLSFLFGELTRQLPFLLLRPRLQSATSELLLTCVTQQSSHSAVSNEYDAKFYHVKQAKKRTDLSRGFHFFFIFFQLLPQTFDGHLCKQHQQF